eukprot:4751867-Pyramimonas_sp.AAC.1
MLKSATTAPSSRSAKGSAQVGDARGFGRGALAGIEIWACRQAGYSTRVDMREVRLQALGADDV